LKLFHRSISNYHLDLIIIIKPFFSVLHKHNRCNSIWNYWVGKES